VVNVEKPKRFLRRLFQAACGNHQKEAAEGYLCRFPQLRHFPQPFSPADLFGSPQPFSPADLFGSRMRSLIFVMGKILAEIEGGQTTIGQAARDHQISRSVIERWRVHYHNNALVDRPSSRERQLEAENEKLKAKVGELVMQMDHLKKLQAWVQRRKSADTSIITAKNWDQFRKPAK